MSTLAQSAIERLEGWMREKEGEKLEFKAARTRYDFDELCKYCCALSNEGGGRIFLGITNERPRTVVGTSAFEQPERTRKDICIQLHINVDFELFEYATLRVLSFIAPARPIGSFVSWKGTAWIREQDSLVPMSTDRMRKIFAEAGRDFSAETCPAAVLSDLDLKAIDAFRSRWVAKATRAGDVALANRLSNLEPEQLLTDCEAVLDNRVTYAALILFGIPEALRRELAQAEVVFEYRSSEASGPAQERREFRRGFFAFQDELWGLVQKRNDQQDFQDGLFVHPIATFSERPVREAILNAICHRDYQLGGNTFVRQFPRRIAIESPGGFPPGITEQNILDKQSPRNRRIAEILSKCGLVERSGQGLNLIYEEQIKDGKAFPRWEKTDAYQVVLTLDGTVTNPAFVGFVERIGLETQTQFTTQDWIVLSLIERNESIPNHLTSYLDKLIQRGLIERAGSRKYNLARRYYEMAGQKGTYTRKKGLDLEHNLAILLKHIRENKKTGSKLNELCQVLPTLKPTQVRYLLTKLKSKGLVHVLGQRKAGAWFPGP